MRLDQARRLATELITSSEVLALMLQLGHGSCHSGSADHIEVTCIAHEAIAAALVKLTQGQEPTNATKNGDSELRLRTDPGSQG